MLLEEIPPEILTLILNEVKRTIRFVEFCGLRFLSRTFATTIEPLAFSSIKIAPYHSPKFIPQVEYLKAGGAPHSRWTTKLIIDQGGHGDPSSLVDTGAIKPPNLEECYLIPAIESLVNVKCAAFALYPTHPHDSILHSLSRLPVLQELRIVFRPDGNTFQDVSLPLYTFPKLSSVYIVEIDLVPSIADSLKAMLAKHTEGLENLTLRTAFSYLGSTVNHSVFFRGLETLLPASLPHLASLTFNSAHLRLHASSVSAFPSLSHLIVEDAVAGTVDPSFWKELSKEGIQLKTLSIYPITAPILQYLQSYSGLVELRLYKSPYTARVRNPIKDNASSKAFHEALATHWSSLRHLAYENLPWRNYGVTEERLQGILECKGLETLWLTYHFPPDPIEDYGKGQDGDNEDGYRSEDEGEDGGVEGLPSTIDMTLLLSNLASNLPHLKDLTLEAKRAVPDLGWCGNAYDDYEFDMAKAFGEMVWAAKAAVKAPVPGGWTVMLR